ncbi:SUKH-4 family immunity protein [Streptomyces sp. NPDC053048]|uniref:SUKH-4 family immunity protein n=1 Tax=Streptomyces sp. NPDC053048 TaxID=3365694 RepID=UPI0037D70E4F
MVTFAQAQERAERWINGDVPAYLQREVRVREFDLGFVAWAEDREDGPTGDGGRVRLVIARDSGETTLWPGLPVGEVIRRYEEEYGSVDEPEPEADPAPPKRLDLNATSFLLSPPEWLQEAADAMGIPDRRSSGSASGGDGSLSGDGAGSPSGGGTGDRPGLAPGAAPATSGSSTDAVPEAPRGPAGTSGGSLQSAGASAAVGGDGFRQGPAGASDGSGDGASAGAGGDGFSRGPVGTSGGSPESAAAGGNGFRQGAAGVSGGSGEGASAGAGGDGFSRGPVGTSDGAGAGAGAGAPDPGQAVGGGSPESVRSSVSGASETGSVSSEASASRPATPEWPSGGGDDASAPPAAAEPWAGADVAEDDGDDHSVGLPATVLTPALSGSDGDDTPPPSVRPDAKTALMPQGSALPRTAIAPAITDAAAPAVPPAAPATPDAAPAAPAPAAPAGGYVRTQLISELDEASLGAGVPGTPAAPQGPAAPAAPAAPGTPPGAADPHAAATMLASPGTPTPPAPPGAPGVPGQPPGAPAFPGAPGTPGTPPGQGPAHAAATMLASPGGPGAPRPPQAPGVPGHPQAPGAPGTPQGPGGAVHAAATMLAGPGTPGVHPPQAPGAPAAPQAPHAPQAPGVPAAPQAPQPPQGYGYPQAPTGLPTVGPGYMAVLRYRAQDGSEQQIIRRSAPGTPHPEWQILHELRAMNVPPQQVLELHTELESCDLPGGYCARMIRETWPQVRISHTAAYGRDHATRQQGVRHLVEHQGELHQVADGPARPAPNRVPLPHPGHIQMAPPVGPDVIGRELAEAFGPQGVFRFDQRAVSRQGVPDIVAQTLVWAGLPADFGPFFWGQAQPGRPVPTLAELAAERGVAAAADAGTYLVMGTDYGRQLCVQYGTAHIVAVPLEAGPGGHPVPPQFVNTSLPQFVRSLALLGKMWRWRYGLTPEQAGRWTVDFQDQLAALDPAALASPENWWAVLLEQMWDGLF